MKVNIHLTEDDFKKVANMVLVQQAEVVSLDTTCWREYFVAKGYQWLIECAEEDFFQQAHDTPDLDPELYGFDAGTGGWLLDILYWLHKEQDEQPSED